MFCALTALFWVSRVGNVFILAENGNTKSAVYKKVLRKSWGRASVGGIATRYGLDGPGIESRWGRDFPHSSRPALGPTQPPIHGYRGKTPGPSS
jgi:hypothetical protein